MTTYWNHIGFKWWWHHRIWLSIKTMIIKKVVSLFLKYNRSWLIVLSYFTVFQTMLAPDARRIPSLSSREGTHPPDSIIPSTRLICMYEFSKVRVKKPQTELYIAFSVWIMIKCYKIVAFICALFIFRWSGQT